MSALGTLFGWRGARQGKLGVQTTQANGRSINAQTEMLRRGERAKWDTQHPDIDPPRELMTPAEQCSSRSANWPI